MGRILAIDYGRKRSGIAVTDPLQIIANGLITVASHELLAFIKQYTQKEKVDAFVIGMPKTLNNEASENQKYIKPFLGNLKKEFPAMPVYEIDERFTSSIAHQTMIDGGLGKKARQDKALVDTISATIILQSYLEQKNNFLL